MSYVFIGYYFSLIFKGKQRGIQIFLAVFLFLVGLLALPGTIRFLLGETLTGGDILSSVIFLYLLFNLLYVLFALKGSTAQAETTGQKNTTSGASTSEGVRMGSGEESQKSKRLKEEQELGGPLEVSQEQIKAERAKKAQMMEGLLQTQHYSKNDKERSKPTVKLTNKVELKPETKAQDKSQHVIPDDMMPKTDPPSNDDIDYENQFEHGDNKTEEENEKDKIHRLYMEKLAAVEATMPALRPIYDAEKDEADRPNRLEENLHPEDESKNDDNDDETLYPANYVTRQLIEDPKTPNVNKSMFK